MKRRSLDGIKLSEYELREYTNKRTFCAEVSKFFPAEVIIYTSEQEGKEYYEYSNVCLICKVPDLVISFNRQTKKYAIGMATYQNGLSTYQVQEIQSKLEKPNQIGVLNEKKINQWVSYWISFYEMVESTKSNNLSIGNAYREKIKGEKVLWSDNMSSGYIVKNGIRLAFDIRNGYVSESISIDYHVNSSFENFVKLSNNNFVL